MNKIDLKNLNTKVLGKNAYFFDEIDSTQKRIWEEVRLNRYENGMVFITNNQTNGYGTHGRVWKNESKDNICFSFLVTPNVEINNFVDITIILAEILVNTILDLYHIKIDIKKPNDLLINGKKIGGILTETKLEGNIVKFIVVGIGLDTNSSEINEEVKNISTSIYEEYNIKIDNLFLISEFLNRIEQYVNKKIGEN